MENKVLNPFFTQILINLQQIERTQTDAVQKAAAAVARTLKDEGIIHTFGSGHSGSVALDPFHRSGCFVAINAILDPGLFFQHGAQTGTSLERLEGYTTIVMQRHDIQPQDTLFVVSNSGRNAAGIEAALYAKQRGATVIAITAAEAHKNSVSRHSSGKMLREIADLVLDNCSPKEEAVLGLGQLQLAPITTISGCALIQLTLYQAAKELLKQGITPPVYKSSNAAANDQNNNALAEKFARRVKHLK